MSNNQMKAVQKQFVKPYITGDYTQRGLANQLSVSEQTICSWVKELEPIKYFRIRQNLIIQLDKLSKGSDYKSNADGISQLITDIERIENLLIKTMAFNRFNQLLRYKDICDVYNHFRQIELPANVIYKNFIAPYFLCSKTTFYAALGTNIKSELEEFGNKEIPENGIYKLLAEKYPLFQKENEKITFESKEMQRFYILYYKENKTIDKVCRDLHISQMEAENLMWKINNKLVGDEKRN